MLSAALLAGVLAARPLGAQQVSSRVIDLLNQFDRGKADVTLAELNASSDRDKVAADFPATAVFWIHAVQGDLARHRTLLAADLALEVARGLTARPGTVWRGVPLVLWVGEQLRSGREPSSEERWLSLASVAELEAHDAWPSLVDLRTPMAEVVAGTPSGSPAQKRQPVGFIGQVRARFPDDSRFELAAAEAEEHATAFAAEPVVQATSLLAKDSLGPAELTELRRLGSIPVPTSPRTPEQYEATRQRNTAREALTRASLVPDLVQEFTALDQVDAIRAEVELHLGYLYARSEAWADAESHLAEVAHRTNDPELLFLADYFRGWIAQNRGDHAAAISAYRRALTHQPASRSASWPLASELLMTGQADARVEARAILNAALESGDDAGALLTYYSGEAWRLSDYLDHARATLRQP